MKVRIVQSMPIQALIKSGAHCAKYRKEKFCCKAFRKELGITLSVAKKSGDIHRRDEGERSVIWSSQKNPE